VEYEFPRGMSDIMKTDLLEKFNIKDVYYECVDAGKKGKEAVDLSMENHFEVIVEASTDFYHALELMAVIQEHVEHRLKHYTKCISKSTPNYLKYLIETYNRQLRQKLRNVLDDE
jgi:hypothetical protein